MPSNYLTSTINWLCLAFIAFAQGPSADWLKKNDRQNRYEGVGFERQVGTPGVELVGMLDSASSFNISADTSLSVAFFTLEPTTAVVIARELALTEFYWMESKPNAATVGRNVFSPWPTEILRQHPALKSDNIGVVVYTGRDGKREVITPAIVHTGERVPPPSGRYQAIFLPDTLLSKVSYRITEGCEGSGKEVKSAALGRQYAQIPFGVSIELVDEGTRRLNIRLNYTRSDGDAHLDTCFLYVAPKRSGERKVIS